MSNKRILVVEDDGDVRLGYQVFLQSNHYDAFFAADAVTAVNQALKRQPDLIILDLGLPAGDGFLVLDRFRANTNLSMVPVIVISARSFISSERRALSAGARAYIQKPWDDDELLALIGKLVGQTQTQPQ